MSPQLADYPRYALQMMRGERSYGEQELAVRRQRDLEPYLDLRANTPLAILDIANGRLRPQYTILRAAGHHVYGIDLVNRATAGLEGYSL